MSLVAHIWSIAWLCVGLVIRAGLVLMCFHSLVEGKPQRKRGNRYAGPALSPRAQAAQAGYVAEMQRRERSPRRQRA
jgi:hypothetical protein